MRPTPLKRLMVVLILAAGMSQAADPKDHVHQLPTNRLAMRVASYRAAGHAFKPIHLFKVGKVPLDTRPELSARVVEGQVFTVNELAADTLIRNKVGHFSLPMPSGESLELIESDYSTLRVVGPEGEDLTSTHTAKHYHGVVKGDSSSVVALSVFRDPTTGSHEVSGVFSTRTKGNGIIGKLKGRNSANEHMAYYESKLRTRPQRVECGHEMDELSPRMRNASPEMLFTAPDASMAAVAAGRCVRLHVEACYDVYQAKGSNATNYVTGFFNVAKAVYAAENIPITLNYLKIWTSPNPEQSIVGYQNIWNKFWNRKNAEGIVGDLAMLVGFNVDRGIAALNPICGPDYNQCGISPIRDYPEYPTYSWASVTFPHEIGHLMGSPHTQACQWNGNNTALDGCVAVEGNCARPTSTYGTIMSYCSNFSLANGFGTQPGNLIRNNFNNGTCLVTCGDDTQPPTVSLTAPASGTTVQGSVNWSASATDDTGVTRVDFLVEGTVVASDTTAPYAGTWDTSTVANGTRTLTAKAYDAAGNLATSAAVTVTVNNAPPPSGALTNGVGVSVSGAQGSQSTFYIDVPTGATNLVMALSGGTGDADLHTKFGAAPTLTTYDCRPYLSGNAETCTVAAPSAGRYYLLIHGYAAYAGATLKASFSTSQGSIALTAPTPGSTVSGTTTLAATPSGLSVSKVEFLVDGTVVGTDTTSPYSFAWNTTQASNGTHSLVARATTTAAEILSSAAVTVTVNNASPCVAIPSNQLTVGTLHCVPAGTGTRSYWFRVPTGATSMTITTSGGTGNGDIYVSPTSWASTTNYSKKSTNAGNTETLTDVIPAGVTYVYVSVIGNPSGMTLRVTTN